MKTQTEGLNLIRHRDEKIASLTLEKGRTNECKWCKAPVAEGQETELFRGFKMHRLCSLEARVADLAMSVEKQRGIIEDLQYREAV